MISSLLQDLRYALRQLSRSPAFAIAAILTLGLGIGATTAIFSVVNGLLLRPPAGVVEFDRLVSIYTSDYSGPLYGASSLPDVEDFREGTAALSGVAAYTIRPIVLSDGGGAAPAEMVLGQIVTPNYFDLLGARPPVGRGFLPDEGTPGEQGNVVILGHQFWRDRFGGDPGIVGETIRLAGVPYTVVGIAEEGFRGLLPVLAPALFVPVGAPGISDGRHELRGSRGFFVFGRLAGDATLEQARTQLRSVAAGLHEQYPDAWTNVRNEPRSVTLIPTPEATVPPQVRGPALGFAALVMAIASGVLLIACANIANLLLARSTGRRREIGIRLAIGASRGRVARQLLTESMVLAGFGALLGILIAWSGTRVLALFTTGLPLPFTVRLDIGPDLRVLGFAAVMTIIAGTLSGFAPALFATRRSLSSSLHRDEAVRRRFGPGATLAAGQIAVAMLLLTAGGLLVRSLLSAQSIDPGFRADGLLSVSLAVDEQSTTPDQRLSFQQEVLERVRGLPGVSSASYASSLPLGAGDGRRGFVAEGYTPGESEDTGIHFANAGAGYFQTMGTRILRGREFEATDQIGAPTVAIINEAFAQRYFQGLDPLGRQLSNGPNVLTVVGIAQDGKYVTLGEEPLPFVWLAADQWPPAMLTIVVRAGASAENLGEAIRRIVAEADQDVAVTGVAMASQHLSFVLLPQRTGAWLLGLFGALGLALAALGIYGLMAYSVNQRTREFGIRLALGAQPRDLTRMVLRQGMTVCMIGGAIGLALAAGVSRLMRFLLFGIEPLDPMTFVGVATLVFGIALLANWLPARRTAKANPLESLRFD